MVTGRLSRAMVVARRGMVATGHPLASAAGLRILTAGGNAVDAAVAIAGVLGVAQPMMSGLGADTFMLVYRASERKLFAVKGRGAAPCAAARGRRGGDERSRAQSACRRCRRARSLLPRRPGKATGCVRPGAGGVADRTRVCRAPQ